MVKLTTKYIIRKINSKKQFLVRRKNETDREFLNRITHLYLQNQFIDQIGKVTHCQKVSVVYLHNNMLRTLENIDRFPNLTHLYLQRNFLVKIDCLEPLQQLKKIYLGFNEIMVFEGFSDLPKIKEIHIENQDLPLGESFLFEPQTILSLQSVLQVLDISHNKLTSLSELKGLLCLEVLIANDNCLFDLNHIVNILKEWPFLKKLSLIGNPVTQQRLYRDSIIFASKNLEVLDDKDIHAVTRQFIVKLTERRKNLTNRKNEEDYEIMNLINNEKKGSKSVKFTEDFRLSEEVVSPLNTSVTVNFFSPAWQLRSNINPVNPKTFLPRPYWKKGGMQNLRTK